MKILKQRTHPDQQVRVISILKTLILETDGISTSKLVPHGALLRGEALEALTIRNRITLRGGELQLLVFSNSTLWEVKQEIARVFDYSPKYLQLEIGSGYNLSDLKETDNGKTMKELGIKGGEIITAKKAAP